MSVNSWGSHRGNALYRTTGSLAFVAAARAAFLVAADPDCPKRKLLLPLKTNLAEESAGLAYTIFSAGDDPPSLIWDKEPVSIRANDVLTKRDEEDRDGLSEVVNWLGIVLRDGPMTVKDLQAEAKAAGLSWMTVRRAKQKLGVVSEKSVFNGPWRWTLRDDDPGQPPA